MRRHIQLAADIRGPLAGMIELADLLLESGLTERQRGYASAVRSAASEVLRRVEARLDGGTSGGAAGSDELYEFRVVEALHAAVGCCEASTNGKGADVRVVCDPALPETIVGDGRRIVYLVAEMLAVALSERGRSTATLHVAANAAGGLTVQAGPVGGGATAWFAAELASRIGGAFGMERLADGSAALTARIPARTTAAVIQQCGVPDCGI